MRDIEIAIRELPGSSLVIVNAGIVLLKKEGKWINPILDAFSELGETLSGSSIADRVIGKAAAAICIVAKIKSVYSPVMGYAAAEMLKNAGVEYQYEVLIPGILNPSGTDLCLAEKTLMHIDDPDDAVGLLYKLIRRELPEQARRR
jgi:hypothetical protein